MDLLACVEVPAFPLQLLLRKHPSWRSHPVAVVDKDSPQGVVQWVNERARKRRVLPGLRFSAGLSLASDLRAGVVSEPEILRGKQALTDLLTTFTPEVEVSSEIPGVFWLNAAGLSRLHQSLQDWAKKIRRKLKARKFQTSVVLGFTRFGTYAVARVQTGVRCFSAESEEQEFLRRVPLELLHVDPGLREDLDKLGARTVGNFMDLPRRGLRRHFGESAAGLHRQVQGASWNPLFPEVLGEPLEEVVHFDQPVRDLRRLRRTVTKRLDKLWDRLPGTQMLEAVELSFYCEVPFSERQDGCSSSDRVVHEETLRPATPTRERPVVANLLKLFFEKLKLPGEVEDLILRCRKTGVRRRQEGLFRENPRRSLPAATRALARVRAQFGNRVFLARLREGHLPEACFAWEPWQELAWPRPVDAPTRPLIRRLFPQPVVLSPRRRHDHDDGWLLHDLAQGSVVKCSGPYIISGGWWNREVAREYHYAETMRGDFLWVFYDQARRRWFLHGEVE